MDFEELIFIATMMVISSTVCLIFLKMILGFFRERTAAKHGAFRQSDLEALLRHVVDDALHPIHQRIKNIEVKLDDLPTLPPAEEAPLNGVAVDEREEVPVRR